LDQVFKKNFFPTGGFHQGGCPQGGRKKGGAPGQESLPKTGWGE